MITGRVIPEISVLDNLFFTTVRIFTYNSLGEENGVGTGFFFHFDITEDFINPDRIPVLVTNKHMISGSQKAKIVFHLGPISDGLPTGGTYELEINDFETKFILHPETDIDLCVLEIQPFLDEIKKNTGNYVHYQAFTIWQVPQDIDLKTLFPISDVYMIGYPEGMWDEKNNLPISRKGVTASHPFFDFEGKSQGLVDIAAFQGSSGSPIISYQLGKPAYDSAPKIEFKLLGILWGGAFSEVDGELVVKNIPTVRTKIPRTIIRIHLGYYIKAKELLAFEPFLHDKNSFL